MFKGHSKGIKKEAYRLQYDLVFSSCKYDRSGSAEIAREIFLNEDIKGKVVLDLGCGVVGPREEFFLSKKEVLQYIGVDFSFEALKISKRLSPDVYVILADISRLPFKKDSIDVILCRGVITIVPDMESAIQNILSLLKKEGKLYMDFTKESYVLSIVQITSLLLGKLPLSSRIWLSKIMPIVAFPFLRIIIGKKAEWGNREKMSQVLMSSVFSPIKTRAVKEGYIRDLFAKYGTKDFLIMDMQDSNEYSNSTTFMVMAQK